jgi:hypothetical protein
MRANLISNECKNIDVILIAGTMRRAWDKGSKVPPKKSKGSQDEDELGMSQLPEEEATAQQQRKPRGTGSAASKTAARPKAAAANNRAEEDPEQAIAKAITMKDVAKISKVMLKLMLACSQQLRDIAGCMFYTLIVPQTLADKLKAMQTAGKKYSAQVAEMGPKHKLGPPHIHKFLAMIEAMTIPTQNIFNQNSSELADLRSFHDKILVPSDLEQISALVTYLKVKTTYAGRQMDGPRSGEIRISFCLRHKKILSSTNTDVLADKVVLNALEHAGGKICAGAAPPGELERMAQSLLQKHFT